MAGWCTCDPGDYWQPPARDPACPLHGYDEDALAAQPPEDKENSE